MIVDRLVAHAIAAYDPEDPRRPRRTSPGRVGTSRSPTPRPTDFPGTSHLEATGDTLVLKDFYDQVCAVAHQLHLDGDTSTARRPQDQGPRHPHRPTRERPASLRSKVYVRVDAHRPRTRHPRRRRDRAARRRHPHQDPHLGRPPPGRHPTRPQHGPPRRRRLPRPTAWMRDLVHAPRRPLHLPQMHRRRPLLRPRPHDPLRRGRTTRPNPARQPRLPSAGDTTAPRPPAAGGTSARPTATTTGTDPTARRTSSPRGAPGAPDGSLSVVCVGRKVSKRFVDVGMAKVEPGASASGQGPRDVPVSASAGSVRNTTAPSRTSTRGRGGAAGRSGAPA